MDEHFSMEKLELKCPLIAEANDMTEFNSDIVF